MTSTFLFGNHSTLYTRQRLYFWIVVLFCAVGSARIISTYSVFNQTTDEPLHIACGMEWLERGTYTYEDLHPPLARVSTALLPYLHGSHLRYTANMPNDGNAVLEYNNQYSNNLFLSRLGILPFFIIGAFLLWFWAKKLFGEPAALGAVFFFTTLPTLLAHGGMATTDMASATTIFALCFVFTLWLEQPSLRRTILLGSIAGIAFTTKFSALFFFPFIAIACALLYRLQYKEAFRFRSMRWTTLAGSIAIAGCTAFLVIWIVYRFSFDTVLNPQTSLDAIVKMRSRWGVGTVQRALGESLLYIKLPAHEFFGGIARLLTLNQRGFASYLLGKLLVGRGSVLFFPVALGVKTPLSFLLLTAIGIVMIAKSASPLRWLRLLPVAISFTILLICLPSNINIGVRHVLSMYPFWCMVAGYALVQLWQYRPYYLGSVCVILCISWYLFSTISTHPNYLSYFNEFGGRHPENILVDSDLDWGQDLYRLRELLQKRNIDHVSLAYFGTTNLSKRHLPTYQILKPDDTPVYEWVAVSMFYLKTKPGLFWLEQYQPVDKAGASILLYHVPKEKTTGQ